MEYIKWFDELTKDSGSIAGGKGSNLGEMINLIKLPVPPGFVATTKAFDKFIEFNQLKEKIQEMIEDCDVDDTEQLLQTSKNIKQLILRGEYPQAIKYEITQAYNQLSVSRDITLPAIIPLISAGREYAIVAVRSSATAEDLPSASFAGQMATFLNVKGITELIEKIKECWASLYEPRAIFYRNKQGVKHSSIAVIIQRMIPSEKSGVMFTVNPSTGEDNIVIEATWGLGETLVQGEVEPDRYAVSKTGEIVEKKIGSKLRMRVRDIASDRTVEVSVPRDKINQPVLNNDEILKLANYGLVLEEHYQKPQDVEFAIEKNRIYITQTRAITTEAKVEEWKIEGKPILKGLGVSPGIATGTVKIVHKIGDLVKIQKGDILVTEMTSPDMVVTMSRSSAIVTDSGGQTCHAAIVSREMGLPAIVGTQNATKTLQEGQLVTVDAHHGLVYSGEVSIEKPEEVEKELSTEELKTKTKILMNLGIPEKIEEYKNLPFDGIGLMRIEFVIASHVGEHPNYLLEINQEQKYVDKLVDGIKKVAEAIKPRFVVVRFSDFKTNEYRELKGGERYEPVESNPLIGWRGVSRYISKEFEKAFRLECKAIKKVRDDGLENVWIMLPFVRTTWEVERCLKIMEEECLERDEKFKVWIMVEVPSTVILADKFARLCDGFSIGSNDLAMLILGVDRDSNILANMGYFDEKNEAVLRSIEQLIKVAHEYNITVSICGQAPSVYEDFTEFLVENGIDSISVNPDVVEKTRKLVYDIEKRFK
ncbi:phosphoenolpyruvate synthase [archaeon]|nr:phosphoenolpyruvate synthase [archaeon]